MVLFAIAAANLLAIIGAVVTGYEAHEVAAFLALNAATMALLFSVLSLNAIKHLYDRTIGKKEENNEREIG